MKTHSRFSPHLPDHAERMRARHGQENRRPAPGSGKTHPVSVMRLGGVRHCRHR
ncbi:MAG: hypothetical protein KDJ31_14875 [Candidatus Competibacteraceae bacterium]|nr:hypothetical protein [Candidatus Competibacteraceae bacterium]MCB1819993.1 hypothetical protein [Candidatus Competibacteraceae bacterium]